MPLTAAGLADLYPHGGGAFALSPAAPAMGQACHGWGARLAPLAPAGSTHIPRAQVGGVPGGR